MAATRGAVIMLTSSKRRGTSLRKPFASQQVAQSGKWSPSGALDGAGGEFPGSLQDRRRVVDGPPDPLRAEIVAQAGPRLQPGSRARPAAVAGVDALHVDPAQPAQHMPVI